MTQIALHDLKDQMYTKSLFTTIKVCSRSFYPLKRQTPLRTILAHNSFAMTQLHFETNTITLFDQNRAVLQHLKPPQIKDVQLGLFYANIALKPLHFASKRYLFSLIFTLTSGQQLHLLSDELTAFPFVIAWLKENQIALIDQLELQKNYHPYRTFSFSQFLLLSQGTKYAQMITLPEN